MDALDLVAGRLLDFFGRRTSWHRRLWTSGLLTGLAEAAEFGGTVLSIGRGQENLLRYRRFLQQQVLADAGMVGSQKRQLASILGAKTFSAQAVRELRQLQAQAAGSYLENWRREVSSGQVPIERLSRAIASTLLDGGFSPSGLHRWLTGLMNTNRPATIDDLLAEAARRLGLPERTWHVAVPVERMPFRRHARPGTYLEALDALASLPRPLPPGMVRVNGAFKFSVEAKDAPAAATRAGELLARITARVTVGLAGNADLRLAELAWVERVGVPGGEWSPIRESQRSVEVGTLYRQGVVFELPEEARALDDAFQLLATIETGSPGSAIASGWAAIESLLQGPDERGGEVAASRMATIVACSLARAELTTLAYSYQDSHDDELAGRLRRCDTNRQRAHELEVAIRRDHPLTFSGLSGGGILFQSASDEAALLRVKGFISDPDSLRRAHSYLETAFLRLHRLRNLVMHGGSAASVATPGVIGTMPPLIGAGIDRIAHGLLGASPQLSPLELAARATVALKQVLDGEPRSLSGLLENP